MGLNPSSPSRLPVTLDFGEYVLPSPILGSLSNPYLIIIYVTVTDFLIKEIFIHHGLHCSLDCIALSLDALWYWAVFEFHSVVSSMLMVSQLDCMN